MGIINDGSISGVLPSSGDAFAVHYPGYPSSTERAIETLGGSQGILKVHSDKSSKLELHFRPEDPYSHPAFGELQSCNHFLLKISRKKVKINLSVQELNQKFEHKSADSVLLQQNSSFPESTETSKHSVLPECESNSTPQDVQAHIKNEAQWQLSADIVARVPEAYYFNGMVDYQHVLAVHADTSRRKKRNWAEVEPEFEKRSLVDVDHEDLMIIVPPLFSLKDLPEKVVLKASGDPSLKKKLDVTIQQHSKMEIEECLAIDVNIKDVPKKVNWQESIPMDSELWQCQMAVCELFEERPIWRKEILAECLIGRGLNIRSRMLRRILFIAAYYFSNGPYRRLWIRKGYDPRKDIESRIYQMIDFRVPPSLRGYSEANDVSGSMIRWEDICAFQDFPPKSQILLQLFDLKDDYIQEEIRKPTSQETCSPQTGWFSSHVLDCLRLRVAQRFLSVYPEAGAESILKSISKRFERAKKLLQNPKDSKVKKDGKQPDKVAEVIENEVNEIDDDVEHEEDDDDEIDYDNLEEDVDADVAPDPVDAAGDFPLQLNSHIDHENFSKYYLQDLFCSFPFASAGGDRVQDADDPSDGEYQIYEQYSDENFSDDEDY